MRRIILFILFCCICCLIGCEKEKNHKENKELGCITGKVTFFNTGQVTNAYVRLMSPNTSEAVYSGRIGGRGDYKIDNVEPGSYIFKVYKFGFIDTIFPEMIKIMPAYQNNNECRQMDWAISVAVEPLQVLDVNTNEPLDTLDFGTSMDNLYFKIRNRNGVTCTWTSDFLNVSYGLDWLSEMNPSMGRVEAYSEQVVGVRINRTPWEVSRGIKVANFMIESNLGGWVITVVADIE